MKRILLFVVFVPFVFACSSSSKVESTTCNVVPESLKGVYQGGCKKGFAHGKGVAKGADTYEGEFKKGYPEGTGKLISKDGNVFEGQFFQGLKHGEGILTSAEGEKIKGFWKNDKYVGDDRSAFLGYSILKVVNLESQPVFKRVGEKNNINFEITGNREVRNFSLQEYSSGTLSNVSTTLGRVKAEILNVNYPFQGQISYQVQNKSGNFFVDVIIKFEVVDSGEWSISTIHN